MACNCDRKFDELTEFIKGVHNPEHPQGALISILHFAQEKYGYLSKEIMDHVSCETRIPTAEIFGVATFYSYFRLTPQGKHKLTVCMGTACYIRGAPNLIEAIEGLLDIKPGETTSDGLFTLDQTRCIGACGLAPVMLVDDKVYARVEPHQVKAILDEWQE